MRSIGASANMDVGEVRVCARDNQGGNSCLSDRFDFSAFVSMVVNSVGVGDNCPSALNPDTTALGLHILNILSKNTQRIE
jgi:hypothetical protein